ncbi:hypothetical protein BABINDRAFT_164780 [Babjeviella inositovora NRRL Y-12698]|uniref:non-specific serine/threonine protein kinase n=1 Tax=Babjeviella inositovora NRRL Y-12698 TaxID=984486 RepID=A0A1E3QZG9_9ASCO|nr:uncharacterized protein BABINDRAFT_164780 [Babjeviella inositovora NRRL Y-12698]ODQ83070.1 hypothetical protein BABINDRAFT_164780 [Babjeviella inositovora NRRL Y-12698]
METNAKPKHETISGCVSRVVQSTHHQISLHSPRSHHHSTHRAEIFGKVGDMIKKIPRSGTSLPCLSRNSSATSLQRIDGSGSSDSREMAREVRENSSSIGSSHKEKGSGESFGSSLKLKNSFDSLRDSSKSKDSLKDSKDSSLKHLLNDSSTSSFTPLHFMSNLNPNPMHTYPVPTNTHVHAEPAAQPKHHFLSLLPTYTHAQPPASVSRLLDLTPKPPVKETKHVSLEYDPISKRKVLNTYEIIRELGRGQHGKVKLAKDLVANEFVAIKIVDRCAKPQVGRLVTPGSSQEDKIKREIAIMKKCDHPHVVQLREVLDDVNSRKIYLVLEYLETGEIVWQAENGPALTFVKARSVFRDVVQGLEYLHYQGIIHRDIKPGNLLVSSDGVVKISDFGVSFASDLDSNTNEFELCKTAGTPAFYAPELCATNFETEDVLEESDGHITSQGNPDGQGLLLGTSDFRRDPSEASAGVDTKLGEHPEITPQTSRERFRPNITHKVDIWALGVTLYCLLFGQLPFNSPNEFGLFDVIAHKALEFPEKPAAVSAKEFEWCKDLLCKLLEKNPDRRIDIPEIKSHPFVLSDLTPIASRLFSHSYDLLETTKIDVSNEEVEVAVLKIGSKIKKSLARAFIKFAGMSPIPPATSRKPSPLHKRPGSAPRTLMDRLGSPIMSVSHLHSAGASARSASPVHVHQRPGSEETSVVQQTHRERSSSGASGSLPSSSVASDKALIPALPARMQERRASVVSLPVNTSFDSLDSFTDDYLHQKYGEAADVVEEPGLNQALASLTVDPLSLKEAISRSLHDDMYVDSVTPVVSKPSSGSESTMVGSLGVKSDSGLKSELRSTVDGFRPTIESSGLRVPVQSPAPKRTSQYSGFDSPDSDSDSDNELTFAFGSRSDLGEKRVIRKRVMSHESNVPRPLSPSIIDMEIPMELQAEMVDMPDLLMNDSAATLKILSSQTSTAKEEQAPVKVLSPLSQVCMLTVSIDEVASHESIFPMDDVRFELSEEDRARYQNHYNKEHIVLTSNGYKYPDTKNTNANAQVLSRNGAGRVRSSSITVGILSESKYNKTFLLGGDESESE